MAISKLGDINPKYFNYFETYYDKMVNEDGTVNRYDMSTYNIDMIRPATSLLPLYKPTGKKKKKKKKRSSFSPVFRIHCVVLSFSL